MTAEHIFSGSFSKTNNGKIKRAHFKENNFSFFYLLLNRVFRKRRRIQAFESLLLNLLRIRTLGIFITDLDFFIARYVLTEKIKLNET